MSSDFMAMDCSPLSELKTTLSIQVYVQIAYHIIFMIQCMWSLRKKSDSVLIFGISRISTSLDHSSSLQPFKYGFSTRWCWVHSLPN